MLRLWQDRRDSGEKKVSGREKRLSCINVAGIGSRHFICRNRFPTFYLRSAVADWEGFMLTIDLSQGSGIRTWIPLIRVAAAWHWIEVGKPMIRSYLQ